MRNNKNEIDSVRVFDQILLYKDNLTDKSYRCNIYIGPEIIYKVKILNRNLTYESQNKSDRRKNGDLRMKIKQYIIMGIAVCMVMGSMSGCSSKEDGNSQSSQKEQTIQITQTGEEQNKNEDVKKEEELQPTTVNADYTEAFQSIQGCAVIWDKNNNTYTFYNEDKCKTRVSPNSTFKVISTLMGIHNHVLTSADSKMGYDGTNYPIDTWNADLSLEDAFQSSCVWYFRKVIDQVGQEEVDEELRKLDYGNCDISEWNGSGANSSPELNGFWLDSSLQISPIEQLEVLHKIVEGKTIYTETEIEILKSIMLIEDSDSKKIYGKTGTGTGTDGTAWFIGFVEKDNTNIYFAIYLDDDSTKEISGTKAKEIALNILQEEP